MNKSQRTEGVLPLSVAAPGSPTPPPVPTPVPVPTSTFTPTVPTTPVSGKSCVSSDPAKLCMAIKIVTFKDAQGVPRTSQTEMEAALAKINFLWSACNLGFQIQAFDVVDPIAFGWTYVIADSLGFLYDFAGKFASNQYLVVGIAGSWKEYHLGWTFISPGQPLGLVLNPKEIPNTNTMAHELGHYMGLNHTSSPPDNVMQSTDMGGVQTVTAAQCQFVRANIPTALGPMLRH